MDVDVARWVSQGRIASYNDRTLSRAKALKETYEKQIKAATLKAEEKKERKKHAEEEEREKKLHHQA